MVTTLTDLVNDYIKASGTRSWRRDYVNCLKFKTGARFITAHLPKDIITICTYGFHFDKKRNLFVPMAQHQRHISASLPLIVSELHRRKVLSLTFASFEDLFDFVTNLASTVRASNPSLRFGPIANYDIACRLAKVISAPDPADFVYFQGGALTGIKNLYANAGVVLPPKARPGINNYTIKYSDLMAIPQFTPLSKLTADEIEDLCCIHSSLLSTIKLP